MSEERMKELLNSIVEYELIGTKISEAATKLMAMGFEKDELIEQFNFDKNDIERGE